MSKKTKGVPKDGDIYHNGTANAIKTATGIVSLSKERQIHTLKEVETPELLKAIVQMTTHIEVRNAAKANPHYPDSKANEGIAKRSIIMHG